MSKDPAPTPYGEAVKRDASCEPIFNLELRRRMRALTDTVHEQTAKGAERLRVVSEKLAQTR